MTALGLSAEPGQVERLLAYLDLLLKWGRVFNLTAIRDLDDMVVRHLLDSLAVRPLLGPGTLADVGTGAGLPGLPIALTEPERAVTLIESSAKKQRFLHQVVAELGLSNVTLQAGRVESYHPSRPFATVISRAFASIADFLASAGHLVAPGGRILAMKGRHPGPELEALPPGFALAGVHRLSIPGLAAERHVVEIRTEAS